MMCEGRGREREMIREGGDRSCDNSSSRNHNSSSNDSQLIQLIREINEREPQE
jgi:hypothetical protein